MNQSDQIRTAELMVFVTAAVFVLLGSYPRFAGDTAYSRLATVEALTQHGTWYIDRPEGEEPNRFEQRTIDKVMVKGRMLSSKPPMLPLFMTGEYVVLHRVLGLTLDDEDDVKEIIRWMTITFSGIPFLVLLIFFSKTLAFYVTDPASRLFCLVALAFGTQLWGYAATINNHIPAASLVMVSLYFALGLASRKLDPTPGKFIAFGLAAGLVPTIDMPGAIFPFMAGLYLLYTHPELTLRWATIGAGIPLLVHSSIMMHVTGLPLPVQMNESLYLYEASYWRNPRGIDALNEPFLVYFFHMTIGRCGIFSLYPVTALGLGGAFYAWRDRAFPQRKLVLWAVFGFAIATLYYATSTNNYGGEAFGFRWYIVAMPILLLMAAPWIARLENRWAWLIIVLMFGVSFYSAWQCTVNPWGANHEWTTRFLGTSY